MLENDRLNIWPLGSSVWEHNRERALDRMQARLRILLAEVNVGQIFLKIDETEIQLIPIKI